MDIDRGDSRCARRLVPVAGSGAGQLIEASTMVRDSQIALSPDPASLACPQHGIQDSSWPRAAHNCDNNPEALLDVPQEGSRAVETGPAVTRSLPHSPAANLICPVLPERQRYLLIIRRIRAYIDR